MMKRVLFIAYSFPPKGGGGVQRSVKFVKYLPQAGWMPFVLSGPPSKNGPIDPTLTLDVPPNVPREVIRGPELPHWLPWSVRISLTRWVLTVDGQIGWWLPAVRRGRSLLRNGEFSSLYSTSAPITGHLVAMRLHKETGLPWVADFRDPWLDNFSARFATRWHRKVCAKLEHDIVHQASRVVVVSEPMKKQLLKRYPALGNDSIDVIPNGYDRADFDGVKPRLCSRSVFCVTYTGSLYGDRQSIRSFLLALRKLIDGGRISCKQFNLRLVGSAGNETPKLVKDLQLDHCTEFIGRVPHKEAVALQLGSDALLLIVGSGPGSEAVATGKIYEYMASNRPILGLVPPGIAADVLNKTRTGVTAHPDDVVGISATLMRMYSCWRRSEKIVHPKLEEVTKYERRRQARKLATILESVSD